MAHQLADETLADILARHLRIPDDDFELTEPYKRHLDPRWRSSSHVLLVCKRWLRVATPLLYAAVVLRSTAQAESLALALKTTSSLGKFIRRLRLEGGFGAAVHKIASVAPDINCIVLNLHAWSTDSTKGICRALPTINPRSLVLVHFGDGYRFSVKENANTRNLRETLQKCIPTWSNLTRVTLGSLGLSLFTPESSCLGKSIASASNLRELHLRMGYVATADVQALAQSPALQTVVLYSCHSYDNTAVVVSDLALKDPRLAQMITRMEEESPADEEVHVPALTVASRAPDFIPLQTCPADIRKRIWQRILTFAMQPKSHTSFDDHIVDFFFLRTATERLSQTMKYMLVSNEFLTIVQELACVTLSLRDESQMMQFARLAAGHAGLAGRAALEALSKLLRTTQLLAFETSDNIPQTHWEELAATSGATLVKLSASPHPFVKNHAATALFVLQSFPALTEVCWSISDESSTSAVPRDALANLRRLDLSKSSPSFLRLLCQMKLPSLREVAFAEDSRHADEMWQLLLTHGHKLTMASLTREPVRCMLRVCPNLTRLEIRWPTAGYLEEPHAKLEVVWFKKGELFLHKSAWKEFFASFDPADFPALREVSIEEEGLEWPTDERSVAKSPWTAYGEKLLAHNVALVDRRIGVWRPRLKTTRVRKPRKAES